MTKIAVNNCASIAIIFPQNDPHQMFIQQKDTGLPNRFGQDEALCPFGGNWLGEEAMDDSGPFRTLVRELDEEWCATDGQGGFTRPAALQGIFEVVSKVARPYRAALVETASEVWSTATKTRAGFVTRVSYFQAALEDDDWAVLVLLQDLYGRLSNEGNSRVTSLDEVLRLGLRGAYGHDQALQQFWRDHGYNEAADMFVYPNPKALDIPWLDSYEDILAAYDIAKTPLAA